MKSSLFATVAFVTQLALSASTAVAFVHGQVMGGRQSGQIDAGAGLSGSYKTTELTAQLLFDYFPDEIPVTAGVFWNNRDFSLANDDISQINRYYQWELGPVIQATLPYFEVKPFVKASLGFGASNAYAADKSVDSNVRFTSMSRNYSIGTYWDRHPVFAPMLEFRRSLQEWDYSSASDDMTPKHSVDFAGWAILAGFQSTL